MIDMEQSTLDWESKANALDVQGSADSLKNALKTGTITAVYETTADKAYKGQAKSDPSRPVIQVEVTIYSDNADKDNLRSFVETYGLPIDELSWLNPKFKLGAFKKRYGKVPRVGMDVQCVPNSEGFFRILI